jgi:hypothetical protein
LGYLYRFYGNATGSSNAPVLESTGLAGIGVSTGAESERQEMLVSDRPKGGSFEHFSIDGAQVADASAALIFLVRFFIKEKMNTIGR